MANSNDSFLLSYSDLSPALGQDATGEEIVLDEEAVNSSIENIFGTSVGERWWFPDFGSHLRSYLFRPMNDTTAELIHTEIITIINLWDSRVSIVDCTVEPNYDEQQYDVTLTWRFRDLNRLGNLNFSLRRYAATASQPIPVYTVPPEVTPPPGITIAVVAECDLLATYEDSEGNPGLGIEQGASGTLYIRIVNSGQETIFVRMPEVPANLSLPYAWSDVMVRLDPAQVVVVEAPYTVTGPGPYVLPMGACIGDFVLPEFVAPPPDNYLIQEDEFYILQENGDFLLTEEPEDSLGVVTEALDQVVTEGGDPVVPEGV